MNRVAPVLLLLLAVAHSSAQTGIDAAMKAVSAGRLDEGVSILRELERTDPRNPEVPYRLGLILFKLGRFDEARQSLESAAKLNPEFPYLSAALALVHDALARSKAVKGDAPGAAGEFQEAIRLDPSRPAYYLGLGQLLLDHETTEPAELVLQKAAERFPGNADVLRMLGLAQFASGKMQPALDALLRAVAADPDAEIGYASLESLLPEAGPRMPEIVTRLRNFASRHPESPIGPHLLALAGEPNREELLARAIAAAPGFWPAHFELYKVLRDRDNWDQAVRELQKTIQLNPDFAPAHYAMAEYYNRINDRAGAARERELHHRLLAAQRKAEQEHRAQAPRLAFTVEGK